MGHVLENLLLIVPVAEVGRGHGVSGFVESGSGVDEPQEGQLLGFVVGQGTEEDTVHDAEHGRRGADPENQGKKDRRRIPRTPTQSSRDVPNLPKHFTHSVPPCRTAGSGAASAPRLPVAQWDNESG